MVSQSILQKLIEIRDLFRIIEQFSHAIYDTLQQEEEPGERLLELLQQRTKTIEEIDAVYPVLNHGLEELINHPELATREEIEEIKSQREETIELIKEIRELDEKSLCRMHEQKDNIALKLQQSRASSKAHKAYLQEDIYTEGWFIDQKK
ncbi:MAG: hypothetical protein PHF03_01765 [Syntrophomonadaceae bacterium]|nr:hypothetical protein [Syntrophomonadaceae bacterium]MDD3898981.1 hypothetical protein [Syntrophomonadaceae bacterium]